MDFNLADDVLVAGTQGRGAWKIEKVSEALGFSKQAVDPAVLWIILNQRSSITSDDD